MRAFLIFLFSLLMAAGCSLRTGHLPSGEVPPYAVLHMDVDFTPAERSDQAWAAKMWNKQTNGQATIELVYDFDTQSVLGLVEHDMLGHNYVIRLESDMVVAQSHPETNLAWMTSGGIYNPWGVPVSGAFVVDRMAKADVPSANVEKKTYLHEFGHVLGLPHEPDVQAIMFPSINHGTTACLKKADLDLFCHVNLCDSRPTYPCE